MKRSLLVVVFLLAGCAGERVVYITPPPSEAPQAIVAAPSATPEPTPTAEPTVTPEPTAEPTPVAYKSLTFKASTDKTTKPFHIGTYGATMKLTTSGGKLDCQYALVAAYLFPVGEKVMYVTELDNDVCGTTEETEVFLEPGDYYVEWLIANVQGKLVITPHD